MHRSLSRLRARSSALLFHTIYVCTATASKTRTAAYTPRSGTYYDVRSTARGLSQPARDPMVFDTDSFNLVVDNCASASITNDLRDYISPPSKSRTRIVGVTGVSSSTMVGTVKWVIEDDSGRAHSIILPNTYYAKEAPYKLLSPQHWSQVAEDHRPERNGTWCATYSDSIVLEWNQRQYRRTIPLSATANNVGMLRTAPGVRKFCALSSTFEKLEPPLPKPHYVAAYEGDMEEPDAAPDGTPTTEASSVLPSEAPRNTPSAQPKPKIEPNETQILLRRLRQKMQSANEDQNKSPRTAPLKVDFNLNGPKGLITDDEEPPSFDTLEQEWKWLHDKLKHPPTQRMQWMIELGLLPARLKKLHKPPKCAGCLTWKATKKPWQVKGQQSSTIKEATYCGECVSVDQLDATTPGFIAQLKGILTRRRYRYATVFVDHFSRVDYVVPQMSLTSEETVKAKQSFEVWATSHGVKIKHYHADNGRFQDNAWKSDCEIKGQGVTYCGVGAHWQNGIAEKRIRDLNDMATVILNYAQRKWPQAITTHLWPYALRAASDTGNSLLASISSSHLLKSSAMPRCDPICAITILSVVPFMS